MDNLPMQKGAFPADKEEGMKFSNDILQIIYDEEYHKNLVEQLSMIGDKEKVPAIGMIASHIVGDRVADVRSQTGRKVEKQLVTDGAMAVVSELTEIANDSGFFQMSKQDASQASNLAVKNLQQMGAGSGR